MELQLAHFLIYLFIALVSGAIFSYYIVKSSRIKRTDYETLKETFSNTQYELETQKTLVVQLRQDNQSLENRLTKEQESCRKQEKEIAELNARYQATNHRLAEEKELSKTQQEEIAHHRQQQAALNKELATKAADNHALQDKLDVQKEDIKAIREASELQFEKIANRLLEEKSEKFSNANKQNMEHILKPLQEKIATFEHKIEKNTTDAVARHSGLKEMIKHYSALTEKVGEDANNLAKALKGDFKKQGNWGEVILQSILEKSGLEKDREYFIQKAERDAEGNSQRPDVIIELPDNKRLIVDSKVSLVAYEAMVAADGIEEAERHQKHHSLAVKNHINGLSAKKYHELYQVQSPDFVMMFIPIDTAFSAALRHDPTLFDYAFSKNIIIITASTLLATLKTVESLWKHDKQNRFAMEIAAEAGKMYDKFVGFGEDMEKMGSQLNTVQNTYQSSMNKLTSGSGNLVRRAEKIKELGANTNKTMSASLMDKIG